MVEFYRMDQNFSSMKMHFKAEFPQLAPLITGHSLSSIFEKTLRQALRNIRSKTVQMGDAGPPYPRLHDHMIIYLIRTQS